MESKKQTAVQWLKELIKSGADLELIKKSITKAHNIEMMQIFDAYNQGRIDQASKKKIREARTPMYYYVKTYFS
jgi:hypothetical protein